MSKPESTSASCDLHPSVACVQSVLAGLAAKTGRGPKAWVVPAR